MVRGVPYVSTLVSGTERNPPKPFTLDMSRVPVTTQQGTAGLRMSGEHYDVLSSTVGLIVSGMEHPGGSSKLPYCEYVSPWKKTN